MTGAVRLRPAFDDPNEVLALVRNAGPYAPLARDGATDIERRANGDGRGGVVSFVPPWFRQNFATFGEIHVDGAEMLLHNQNFVDAARGVFGDRVLVVPTTVYVNVMAPCAYPFIAHTDVPVFCGATRKNAPAFFLNLMHASGLFEAERINLVTAVSWFYDGPGGDFHYWPEGPEGPERVETPPFRNVAIVADNEHTYHGVGPVGLEGSASPTGLGLDAVMTHRDDPTGWIVSDHGEIIAEYDESTVRITTSWKAEIYADEVEREDLHSGRLDLTIERIVERFLEDLSSRGTPQTPPSDPFTDRAWTSALTDAYPRAQVQIPQG